ncbi:hypothetical protein [Paenibacillus alvei]|uniref:hypothetical protein n=1 Tax=Paenibacillus alvei TaxID=44250 RepID=UPI002280409E|nr:hypothetical protein [Paenibacillus alvei]
MPRKSKPYITQFFERDRLAFTALLRTGHVSLEHLRQCGLADSRIKNLIRDGYYEKVVYKQSGEIKECYKLSKLGRAMGCRLWGLEKPYHAQNPTHDIAIAEKYFSISVECRDQWSTESQIRDKFQGQLNDLRSQGKEEVAKVYEDMLNRGLISMPDALYVDINGTEIAFEVVTNTYGQDEMRAKETLVEIMNYRYETTRV